MLENGPHLSPWDVLSLGTFCPLGRFVLWDVLSLGRFVLGRFVCPEIEGGGGCRGEGLHSAETRKCSINYHIYNLHTYIKYCYAYVIVIGNIKRRKCFLTHRKVRIPMT